MDNRAVSNTLGYVLLFAVVFASIAAVGTAGVESLTATRDATMAMNAEHTMTGIASAVDDVHDANVSRTSRVRLGSGSLEVGEQTTINVDVGTDGSVDLTQSTRSIVYRTDNTRIVYVAGAIFRMQQEGQVVVHRPDYLLSGSGTILSLPATTSLNPGTVVSGTNARVFLNRKLGSATVVTGSGTDVAIEFQTPSNRQARLWYQALDDEFSGGCGGSPPTGSTVTCTQGSSSRVVVRTTVTDFELGS